MFHLSLHEEAFYSYSTEHSSHLSVCLSVCLSSRKRSRGKRSQQKWFPSERAEWERKHWKGRRESHWELGSLLPRPPTNFLPSVSSAVFALIARMERRQNMVIGTTRGE